MDTFDLSGLQPSVESWADSLKGLTDSFAALTISLRELRESEVALARASYLVAFPHRSTPGGRNPRTRRLRKKADSTVLNWWWKNFMRAARREGRRERTRILLYGATHTTEQAVEDFNRQLTENNNRMQKAIAEFRKQYPHAEGEGVTL